VFYLRKAVPKELRPLLENRREVKFSLHTRDRNEAKLKHAEELAKLEAKWANLRQPVTTISERDAHKRAAAFYDQTMKKFIDTRRSFQATSIPPIIASGTYVQICRCVQSLLGVAHCRIGEMFMAARLRKTKFMSHARTWLMITFQISVLK
jgi:hypothetical protein